MNKKQVIRVNENQLKNYVKKLINEEMSASVGDDVIKKINELKSIQSKLDEALEAYNNSIADLMAAKDSLVPEVMEAFKGQTKGAEKLKISIDNMLVEIVQASETSNVSYKDAFNMALKKVNENTRKVLEQIKENSKVASKVKGQLKIDGSKVFEGVNEMFGKVTEWLSNAYNKIMGFVDNAQEGIDEIEAMIAGNDEVEANKYSVSNMDDVESGALSEEVGDMFEGDKDQMEASGKKMYYHVLEDGGYGNIGHQGYYDTPEEAKKRADDLSEMFPNLSFYVEAYPTKKEPVTVTMEGESFMKMRAGADGKVFENENRNMFEDVKKEKMQMEDMDLGHEDDEPHMLKSDLYHIGKYAMALYQMVDQFEGKGEVDFPHWWQSKIIKAKEMMSSAKHYLDFELKEPKIDAMVGVEDMMNEEIKRFKKIINY